MIAFFAILGESYRYLLAKKLFWITLAISILVALLYGSVGFSKTGMTFWYGLSEWENPILTEDSPLASKLYLLIFSKVIVDYWLTWIAAILALLSTTSIFPDFLQPGSIDLALSKPNSRPFLFLAKYCGSLLFVVLQVAIFTAIIFFIVGFRLDEWRFGLFWAIPLVTLLFSSIYSINVLFGVLTRSPLAALLLTLTVWVLIWGAQRAERMVHSDLMIFEQNSGEALERWQNITKVIVAPLPKTQEITMLLRELIHTSEDSANLSLVQIIDEASRAGGAFEGENDDDWNDDQQRDSPPPPPSRLHSRASILGSSLGFQVVILALGIFLFHRRDF